MTFPLIGLTTSTRPNNGNPFVGANADYSRAILAAGGLPVLVPTGTPGELAALLAGRLDGILLTGGGDINPSRYASSSPNKAQTPDDDRDALELALAAQALEGDLPLLGICRGAQVLNVSLGGSLYTDIAAEYGKEIRHNSPSGLPRSQIVHRVKFTPGSRVAAILGEDVVQVNSLHHQAVKQLAPALQASGFAPDGLVEAVEYPRHPFAIAVQWHPECLPDSPPMQRLFRAFTAAAASFRGSRYA